MLTLGLALAALIGVSLGLLGGGGSVLTVPVFVYVLGFGAKEAIATSLGVVGATSLLGALRHWRAGNVQVRPALVLGGIAMGATYAGARLAVFVSGAAQLTLVAVVMLTAALLMFRNGAVEAAAGATPAASVPTRMPPHLLVPIGIGVGLLTGLAGVGGGFLIVPALVLLAKLPMKQAIGTSLLVIAMNALIGFLGYAGQMPMRWGFMAAFTAIAMAGTLAGASLARVVPARALKRAFAVLLLLVGTFMLYQNRHTLLGRNSRPDAVAGR